MSLMTSISYTAISPGQSMPSPSNENDPRQRMADVLEQCARNAQLAAKQHKEFVQVLDTLKRRITTLEESCVRYNETVSNLSVTRLRENAVRLAKIMEPFT